MWKLLIISHYFWLQAMQKVKDIDARKAAKRESRSPAAAKRESRSPAAAVSRSPQGGDNSTADRRRGESAAADSSVKSEGSSSSAQDAGGSDADDQSNADMQVPYTQKVFISINVRHFLLFEVANFKSS